MDPGRTDLPALGHSGSMEIPSMDHHHHLEVPAGSGWFSLFTGTGMPRRNSIGFSENYDAAPAFCLDEDSNSPGKSGILVPPEMALATRSPPVRKRSGLAPTGLAPPETGSHDIPSPSENFLYSYFSKHHGSKKPSAPTDGASNISVVVSPCEEEEDKKDGFALAVPSQHFQSEHSSITDKLTDALQMDNFPVATSKSLEELDQLKKQILASNFEEKTLQLAISDKKDTDLSPHVEAEASGQGAHFHIPHLETAKSNQPGKLATFIFSQPFAQNWLFKKPENSELELPPPPPPSDGTKPRRAWPTPKRLKEMNYWAPQNL